MKYMKKFTQLVAITLIIIFSVNNTSCSDEESKNVPTIIDTGNNDKQLDPEDIKKVKENSIKIKNDICRYVAACFTDNDSIEVATSLQLDIKCLEGCKDIIYKEVAHQISNNLGIEESSALSIITGNDVVNAIDNLTSTERSAIIKSAQNYIHGYTDAKDFIDTYLILSSSSTDQDDKLISIYKLINNIKEHYQVNNDTDYKNTYFSAVVSGTDLSEFVAKSILESENIEYTVASIFGININNLGTGVIWKEDFGTLDLSDKSGAKYSVWDFSNMDSPELIKKTSNFSFCHKLEDCYLPFSHIPAGTSGTYTIAGYLTGYSDYKGYKGARLEWANNIGGYTNYPSISYDHSGKLDGCALFIDVSNFESKTFYKRNIDYDFKGDSVKIECYANAYGENTDCYLVLRFKDQSFMMTTKNPMKSDTICVKGISRGGNGKWQKLSVPVRLNGKFEIELYAYNPVMDYKLENYGFIVIDDIMVTKVE